MAPVSPRLIIEWLLYIVITYSENMDPSPVIATPLFSNNCNVCQKVFYTSSNPGTANYYRCEGCLKIDKTVYFKSLFCVIQ